MSLRDQPSVQHIRISAAIVLIVLCSGMLFYFGWLAGAILPPQDLASYWAAAHLLKQDPYSPGSVSTFEKGRGLQVPNPPLVMRNPPWALALVFPLRFVGYRVAFALWTMLSVIAVIGCSRAVWQLFKGPESILFILLPFLFGPTLVLLLLGQWSAVMLVGVACFLIAIQRKRYLIAGAALLLLIGKPHLILLFLVVVVLWTFRTRKWMVFVGAVTATALSSLFILLLNPSIFGQYLDQIQHVAGENILYPNLGGLLYEITGKHLLTFFPPVLGFVWLILYWNRHRDEWDWNWHGSLVLAVSVACSYYSYPYDEVLVLPALIGAFLHGNRRAFLVCYAVTNLGYAVYLFQIAGSFGFTYMFLSWTATAWLITILASTMLSRIPVKSVAVAGN